MFHCPVIIVIIICTAIKIEKKGHLYIREAMCCEVKWKLLSRVPLLWPHGLCSPWNSPGQNNGVGSLSLLQGIFSTQGSNPRFPQCRWILYQLSRKGSPRMLEWVAYPFSSGSSWPRNQTRVSCIAGGFFTNSALREGPCMLLTWDKSSNCHLKASWDSHYFSK